MECAATTGVAQKTETACELAELQPGTDPDLPFELARPLNR